MRRTATLIVTGKDQKGLVYRISEFIFRHQGNILHADHHIDFETGLFLSRVEWDLDGFRLSPPETARAFTRLADELEMRWEVRFSDRPLRTAIFVSRLDHCLVDLRADLVVLARYMQILTPDFIARFPNRIINIHHSFLPAFSGARPYAQAHARGVKIIGASSHYVTALVDEGPIIEQDTIRVSHRETVEDLVRKGRDLERIVLARAVHLHLQGRVLPCGNRTVVFD